MEIFNGVIRLPILTVLFFTHGCWSQDIVGPESDVAVLRGGSETLTCSRAEGGQSGTIAWFEEIPGGSPTTMFFGSAKGSNDPKYDNFDIDTDNADRFDLAISDVAVEDEGTYYCQHVDTLESEYSTVTVEVQSTSLEMTADVRDSTTVTVIEGKPLESEIVCTTVGARPIVVIVWHHQTNGGPVIPITTGVSQTNTSNSNDAETFDTVSTLQYDASKDYNGGSISCVTTGQNVLPDISREDSAILNVQYLPVVNVQYGDNEVRCSSDANPEVATNQYIIIVNHTDQYPPTMCADGTCYLDLEVMYNTDVRCNATNSVGTGTASIVAVPGAIITTTTLPQTLPANPYGVELTLNVSAFCRPTTPDNDAIVVIKIDGVEVAVDTEITLPPSSCLLIQCIVTKDSLTTEMERNVCTDVKTTSGVPIAAVAIPLAIIAAAAIAVSVLVIWRTRQQLKDPPDRNEPGCVGKTHQSNIAGPATPQTYMELDAGSREKEKVYQEPQPQPQSAQFPMYEDIGENEKAKEGVYQEMNDTDNSQRKEYVNVKPPKQPRQAKR